MTFPFLEFSSNNDNKKNVLRVLTHQETFLEKKRRFYHLSSNMESKTKIISKLLQHYATFSLHTQKKKIKIVFMVCGIIAKFSHKLKMFSIDISHIERFPYHND